MEKTLKLHDIESLPSTFLQKQNSYTFKLFVGSSVKVWPVWAALWLAVMRWRARNRAAAHVREESCLGKGWGLYYS